MGVLLVLVKRPNLANARPDFLALLVFARGFAVVEEIRWCVCHRNTVSDTAFSVGDYSPNMQHCFELLIDTRKRCRIESSNAAVQEPLIHCTHLEHQEHGWFVETIVFSRCYSERIRKTRGSQRRGNGDHRRDGIRRVCNNECRAVPLLDVSTLC